MLRSIFLAPKMSSESWLKEHESIVRLAQSISQSFNERAKYPKSSSNYVKLTSLIRSQITKFTSNVNALDRNLEESNVTYLEKNRRTNMVNDLRKSSKQFDQMLQDESSLQKNSLLVDLETPRASYENETTTGYTSNQLLQQQDRILAEQDKGIETLAGIIQNQKRIATTIGQEVDRQNVLIDNMGDNMDQVHERLVRETKRIKIFSRKTGTCGIWFLIIMLLIAIIILAALPKH